MSCPCEVAKACKKTLESAELGTGDKAIQDGKDFYKYFFTNFPDLRKYFKGAEAFTATDIQRSERFEKQGQRLLLGCHLLAEAFPNEELFKAYVRETINRHRQFKMEPQLWLAFFTVFEGYLETKTKMDDAAKRAWITLGKKFNAEAQEHLKNLGLPNTI